MVETHKRKRKNTVITKITLTISNGEHIKQTLSTNKPCRHQQHLPKISKNVCTDGNSIWKKYLHCSITTMLELLSSFIKTRLTEGHVTQCPGRIATPLYGLWVTLVVSQRSLGHPGHWSS